MVTALPTPQASGFLSTWRPAPSTTATTTPESRRPAAADARMDASLSADRAGATGDREKCRPLAEQDLPAAQRWMAKPWSNAPAPGTIGHLRGSRPPIRSHPVENPLAACKSGWPNAQHEFHSRGSCGPPALRLCYRVIGKLGEIGRQGHLPGNRTRKEETAGVPAMMTI